MRDSRWDWEVGLVSARHALPKTLQKTKLAVACRRLRHARIQLQAASPTVSLSSRAAPSVAEHQQNPPTWHAKRSGGEPKNQPFACLGTCVHAWRRHRPRLAPPRPSASPPGGSIDAVAVATRGPGRVQSSRDSLACRPSGQNETTLCLYRGLASRFFGLTFQGIILAVND